MNRLAFPPAALRALAAAAAWMGTASFSHAQTDVAWTHARSADSDPAGNRIPNAVDKVGPFAVTVRDLAR